MYAHMEYTWMEMEHYDTRNLYQKCISGIKHDSFKQLLRVESVYYMG